MSTDERRAWIKQCTEVLQTSTEPDELEAAAEQLAAADDPDALDQLGGFLSRSEFLERLDDPSGPDRKMLHLRNALRPFIERPSPEVAALCLSLAENPVFQSEDEWTPFLLEALANVRPMTPATVEFFRRTNEQGYFAANSPLLVHNDSPLALNLFVEMMSDREVDLERRVDCLHMSIIPYRTRLSTLETAADLLARNLEEPVVQGVIESVFDFQWQWFGTHPPERPAWRSADTATLRFLTELGENNRRADLPASVKESIERTIEIAHALLSRRAAG